jgi:RNA polymerase sigma-70 factor (ECF subfamily)
MAIRVHSSRDFRAGLSTDAKRLPDDNEIPTPTTNGAGTDEILLIRKIVAGQRDLFGELIAPHLTALSHIVRATIGGHPEVEDIVQQTALKAFTHLAQFRFEAGFKTWLFQIGLNEVRQWRLNCASSGFVEFTPHAFSELAIADQSHSPLIECQRSETSAQLGAALVRLPKQYRNVVLLLDFEDLSISEVAVRLGLTIPAVKSRRWRARQKLRDFLSDRRLGRANTQQRRPRIPNGNRHDTDVG